MNQQYNTMHTKITTQHTYNKQNTKKALEIFHLKTTKPTTDAILESHSANL